MFVEDVLIAISNKIALSGYQQFAGLFNDEWHRSFIFSVARQVTDGRALSVNQTRVALKLIQKAMPYIFKCGIASADDIRDLLTYPRYRKPPYESTKIPREARYLGDNLLGLRCKYDTAITAQIKNLAYTKVTDELSLTPPCSRARFDWAYKIWIVPVHHYNLSKIMVLLREHRFHLDQMTTDYLKQCKESIGQPSVVAFIDEGSALRAHVRDQDIFADWITEIAGGIVL